MYLKRVNIATDFTITITLWDNTKKNSNYIFNSLKCI